MVVLVVSRKTCDTVCVCSVVLDSAVFMDCSLPDSSVYGLFQARILELVSVPFSRYLCDPGIEPMSLVCIALAGGFFTTRKQLQNLHYIVVNYMFLSTFPHVFLIICWRSPKIMATLRSAPWGHSRVDSPWTHESQGPQRDPSGSWAVGGLGQCCGAPKHLAKCQFWRPDLVEGQSPVNQDWGKWLGGEGMGSKQGDRCTQKSVQSRTSLWWGL